MKLTWDQKELRREARRAGEQALSVLQFMREAQREADLWRPVDQEQEMFWHGRANKFADTAVTYARRAARAALQSVALDKPEGL